MYKNPFAGTINEESQTIGLHETINFLKNEGHKISKNFEVDLKWLKKLRNSIEHHKFEMNIAEVEETIGRLMKAVNEFSESHESTALSSYISETQFDLFHQLADTYETRLEKAEAKTNAYKGVRFKEYSLVDFNVYHCYECGHDTMIPNEDSSSGYRCTFCDNDESEDIEMHCWMCDSRWPIWQMDYLDRECTGGYQYYCPYCRRDPAYVKDD